MAKYIKAKQVEAKALKVGKKDGYEVVDGDTKVWMDKATFEAKYVKV